MLGIHDYWAFVVTGMLLNLTPGQDTFFILGRSAADGTKAGVSSVLGITAGLIVHTMFAALGLSAVLATSASAFSVIKWAGAGYLVYLGTGMLLRRDPVLAFSSAVTSSGGVGQAFRQGMLTNLLNPKVALFFLALMPQFIDATSTRKVLAFLALGATFITTGTAWNLCLAMSAGRLRRQLMSRPRLGTWLSHAAGAAFIALGVRLAISRR